MLNFIVLIIPIVAAAASYAPYILAGTTVGAALLNNPKVKEAWKNVGNSVKNTSAKLATTAAIVNPSALELISKTVDSFNASNEESSDQTSEQTDTTTSSSSPEPQDENPEEDKKDGKLKNLYNKVFGKKESPTDTSNKSLTGKVQGYTKKGLKYYGILGPTALGIDVIGNAVAQPDDWKFPAFKVWGSIPIGLGKGAYGVIQNIYGDPISNNQSGIVNSTQDPVQIIPQFKGITPDGRLINQKGDTLQGTYYDMGEW